MYGGYGDQFALENVDIKIGEDWVPAYQGSRGAGFVSVGVPLCDATFSGNRHFAGIECECLFVLVKGAVLRCYYYCSLFVGPAYRASPLVLCEWRVM